MRAVLKDFQSAAVEKLSRSLRRMTRDYWEDGRLSATCLAAPTGAGKTVMSAAAIEALFFGDDALALDPDPHAVVLWLSESPALNEQTRNRIMQVSDKLSADFTDYSMLHIIGSDFAEERLRPRNVYFLSKNMLSRNGILTRGTEATSGRTFWDVLDTTIRDPERNLYLFIDEAHRGLGPEASASSDTATIYANLIDGFEGRTAMPVVVGVSATPQRFVAAMQERTDRDCMSPVRVDPKDVQESGLLKDTIELYVPDTDTAVEHQYLTLACRRYNEACERWAAYCNDNGEPPVSPLLLVQTADHISDGALAGLCDQISSLVPNLEPTLAFGTSFANVFGEHGNIRAGRYDIPYIRPENVQGARRTRVLFAKEAVSNGWDCPRAEVLFSQRTRKDPTYITQLIGRMVRTPLAHRTDDGILDSVACYLPNFNPQTTHEIVDYLTGNGKEPEAAVAGKNGVLENPQDVSPAVPRGRDDYERQMTEWSKSARAASPAPLPGLDDLPETEDAPAATTEPEPVTASGSEPTTIPEPKPAPKPEPGPVNPLYRPQAALRPTSKPEPLTKRDSSFTPVEWEGIRAAYDSIPVRRNPKKARNEFRSLLDAATLMDTTELLQTAEHDVDERFCHEVEGAIAAEREAYDAKRAEVENTPMVKIILDRRRNLEDQEKGVAPIDDDGIEKAAAPARKEFSGDELPNAYQRFCLAHGADIDEANLRLATIVRTSEIMDRLRKWAAEYRGDLFDVTAQGARIQLTAAQREEYEQLERESAGHRLTHLAWPTATKVAGVGEAWPKHIVQRDDGLYPLRLNEAERHVLETELARPYTVAFYRNPGNNSTYSFSIPYNASNGRQALRPDFIFFVRDADGAIRPSIVDPHGDFLADTLGKLRGYVEYLRKYPDAFKSAVMVGCPANGDYRTLDLLDPRVQDAIDGWSEVDTRGLFTGSLSRPYM